MIRRNVCIFFCVLHLLKNEPVLRKNVLKQTTSIVNEGPALEMFILRQC